MCQLCRRFFCYQDFCFVLFLFSEHFTSVVHLLDALILLLSANNVYIVLPVPEASFSQWGAIQIQLPLPLPLPF